MALLLLLLLLPGETGCYELWASAGQLQQLVGAAGTALPSGGRGSVVAAVRGRRQEGAGGSDVCGLLVWGWD
jgi:hypothetical protein